MSGAFRIVTIGGIPISADASWLVAVFIVSVSLAGGFLPTRLTGQSAQSYWLLGVVGALLLFGSVLLHELGHALVARRFKVNVDGITLFLFGGVARLREEPLRPWDEFRIAAAGPLVSALTGLAAFGVGQVATGAVGALADYLAWANAALLLFNLVPGLPLDGGRMLRAVVWAAGGNRDRATTVATVAGQGFALVLVGWGLLLLVSGQVSGGLWAGFIGWYLWGSAGASRAATRVASGLRGVRVADIMDTSPPTVSPSMTVSAFVQEQVIREGRRAALIVVGPKPWGIVTLTDARRVPAEEWGHTAVAQIASRPPLVTIGPTAMAETVTQLLAERQINQVVVLDEHGDVVGVVTRAAILNVLQIQRDAPGLLTEKRSQPVG